MKKIIFFLFFVPFMAIGQTNDSVASSRWEASGLEIMTELSLSLDYGAEAQFMTFSYIGLEVVSFELRDNFDYPNTKAILIGKSWGLKNGKFSVTPQIGFLLKDADSDEGYNGLNQELDLSGEISNFSYFSMSQVALSFNKGNPTFFFSHSQFDYQYWRLRPGYVFEIFWDRESKFLLKHGPSLQIILGYPYLNVWYSWDKSVLVGFGFEF